jgi:hypothetical protein
VNVAPKRYKLLACEIVYREVCYCVSQTKNIIDISFMMLHDIGAKKMQQTLQEEIDNTDNSKYDAILIGYGLCNNGIVGLTSNELPIIVPKAHDCITLMIGSKEKYHQYHSEKPASYFKSIGWVERDLSPQDKESSITSQLGMNKTYQEYLRLYDEDTAKYLMETLGNYIDSYERYTYIDTNIGDFDHYKEQVKSEAQKRNWEYEELEGNTSLLMRLLDGNWDKKDFLVVPPNKQIAPSYDNNVIKAI